MGNLNYLSINNSPANNSTVIAAYRVGTSSGSISGSQTVDYDTQITDTDSAVTTGGSWVFTAPRSAFYYYYFAVDWEGNWGGVNTGNNFGIVISSANSNVGQNHRFTKTTSSSPTRKTVHVSGIANLSLNDTINGLTDTGGTSGVHVNSGGSRMLIYSIS